MRGLERSVSRRRALGWAGLAALAAGAGACGRGPDDGRRTVRFLYNGTAAQQDSWEQLFDLFRSRHPEIELIAEGVPTGGWADFFNKVTTQLAGGQAPDIIQIATEGQQLFASKDLLEPLDPYIERDREYIEEYYADIHPNLVEWTRTYTSRDGVTYYLPGEFNTMAMWCNEEVFAAAGVPAPGPDWTWEEFRTLCAAVRERAGAFGYAAGAEYFAAIMPWLLTNGANALDPTWTRPTVAEPAAVAAAAFNRDLVAAGHSPPPGGTFDPATAATQGRLAMFGGGRWPIIDIRGLDAVGKFRILPWPTSTGPGTPVGFNGYPILRTSRNKDDAWELVKFLISSEASAAFAQIGGTIVPARRSVAHSDAFLANSPPGTATLYDSLEDATPIPSPAQGAIMQRDVEDAWQQILVGNIGPADGMQMLQTQLESLVRGDS
jgi:multiple sugar transport system substrate-binding protein